MAYAQDTITNANAANVYILVLQDLLTDAGWTMVDSGTPSGTYRFQVWQSSGSLNQAGYDWFLALKWNSIGTEQTVDIIGGAAYDSVNKRISEIPAVFGGLDYSSSSTPDGYASPVTGDLWGWVAVNVATTSLNYTNQTSKGSLQSSVGNPWHSALVPSSAFAYWMSVTLDHVGVFTTISNMYMVGTLDVSASWSGAPFPVVSRPLVSVIRNVGAAPRYGQGVSAGIVGTGSATTNYIAPTYRRYSNYGALLPVVDGSYLDAFAMRGRFYLGSLSGASSTAPTFDSPSFGDGFVIGDTIDYYYVNGGSIGDTVVIDGATYVISGPVQTGFGGDLSSFAMLVE